MPGTYSKILLHLVFSTKGRARMIIPDVETQLHAYMGGIVREEQGVLCEIGGTENHIHLLVGWRTDEPVATLMRKVKGGSSWWVHQTFPVMQEFAWQEGYGAFSVSESQADRVREYIRNQVEHHQVRTFEEEFVALLERPRIAYQEQYLWD
jgi:REP element-mobilizing transposase RayT